MSNATTVLPNPYTPMAFVPLEWATKTTNQTYFAVGSLAVSFSRLERSYTVMNHLP